MKIQDRTNPPKPPAKRPKPPPPPREKVQAPPPQRPPAPEPNKGQRIDRRA